jgi:copper chaperone CopZ
MKMVFLLKNLDCANCAAKIERDVSKIDGVKSAAVNFITSKLVMEVDDGMEAEIVDKAVKAAKKTDSRLIVARG